MVRCEQKKRHWHEMKDTNARVDPPGSMDKLLQYNVMCIQDKFREQCVDVCAVRTASPPTEGLLGVEVNGCAWKALGLRPRLSWLQGDHSCCQTGMRSSAGAGWLSILK